LSTFPTTRPGLPTTNPYTGTSLVTTVPDLMRAYSPIIKPQTMVAFTPIDANLYLFI